MASHTFLFDGGSGDNIANTLTFDFARDAPTCDYEGVGVANDEPRYDRPVTIAPASAEPEGILTNKFTSLWASGLGNDGTTALWLVFELRDEMGVEKPNLYVVKTATPSTDGTEFTNSTQYYKTVLTNVPGGWADIMQESVSGKRYSPFTGIICHGSIWLFCMALISDGSGGFTPAGLGIVRSDDLGQSWSVYEDDLDLADDPGHPRGADFMCQNYSTPGYSGSGDLLEAWVFVSDYRWSLKSARGGATANLFRIRRDDINSPWLTDHEIDSGSYTNKSLRLTTDDLGGVMGDPHMTHVHSGSVFRSGDDLVLAIAIGDTQPANRVARLSLEDFFTTNGDVDYTDLANWAVDNNWHGSFDPDYFDPDDGDGEGGNQFVGCIMHPDGDGLIVGSDLTAALVCKLSTDENGRARFDHIYGLHGCSSNENNFPPNCFHLKSQAPEKGGPVTGQIQNDQTKIVDPRNPAWNRVLYSPSGGADKWCMIQRGDEGIVARGLPVGDYIYLERRAPNQTTGVTLSRIPKPATLVTVRPLLVGPGGTNFVKSDYFVEAFSTHEIIEITRAMDGKFYDPDHPLEAIDPQPPVMADKILLVKGTPRSDPSPPTNEAIGLVIIDGGNPPLFSSGPEPVNRVMRLWVLDATQDTSLARSKQTGCVMRWDDRTPNNAIGFDMSCAGMNRWIPFVCSAPFVVSRPFGQPGRVFLTMLASGARGGASDVQRYFLAFDLAGEGDVTPGYPLPRGRCYRPEVPTNWQPYPASRCRPHGQCSWRA